MTAATISPPLLLAAVPQCAPRSSYSSWLCFSPSLQLASCALPRPDRCSRKRRFGQDLLQSSRLWRASVAAGEAPPPEVALPPEVAAVEKSQQIIPTAEDESSVSTIVSALLFVAFIALSLLTIGVIYLAVQDFLQKREREKFDAEEVEKKKGGKKTKAKARAGPRGFGQKIEDGD